MNSIYLDYNATTPLDPQVRERMLPVLDGLWGNPSSVHQLGRRARAHLDECRERTATVLACKPSEVTFTGGGTESNNLAIFGAARSLKGKGRHLVTSAVEHHAVLHCFHCLEEEGFEVTYLQVDPEGRVPTEVLLDSLRPDTILVSLMAANNEIGTIQPFAAVGEICRARGITFHTDAVQWVGKHPFNSIEQFNADLVSICAHKVHGPKGIGALYVRSPFQIKPVILGGSHENERRAGTENLAAIAGLVACLESFVHQPVFSDQHLVPLKTELRRALASLPGVTLVSPENGCLNNTVSIVVDRSDSITLLANLDLEGFCASSGSACSAGSLEPSHVIRALGLSTNQASALVRFSLGRGNTKEEVQSLVQILPAVIERSTSPE